MYGLYWSMEYEKLLQMDSSKCSKLAALAAESYYLFHSASDLFNNAHAPQFWIDNCESFMQLCELRRLSMYARMFMKNHNQFSNPFGKGLCLATYVLKKTNGLPRYGMEKMSSEISTIKETMMKIQNIVIRNQLNVDAVFFEDLILIDEPVEEPLQFYEPVIHQNQVFLAFYPQAVGMIVCCDVGLRWYAEIRQNIGRRNEKQAKYWGFAERTNGNGGEKQLSSKRGSDEPKWRIGVCTLWAKY